MRALPRPGVAWLAVAAVAAAGIAVAVLAVASDGGGAPAGAGPTGSPTRPVPAAVSPPTDPGLDYRDPSAVCVRFADAVYRRDTRTDPSPQAAYRRATAYLTAELAAAVAAQPEGRDAQWTTWRAHQAATSPTVTEVAVDGDARPADTANESYRDARVTLTPVGVDGWRGPAEEHLVLCTLRRDDVGRWRVERYQVSDLSDTP
jgi:hypothetical protein